FYVFFFFQAEDGIRDFHVTGVQTCALPISRLRMEYRPRQEAAVRSGRASAARRRLRPGTTGTASGGAVERRDASRSSTSATSVQIGRASCRERGSRSAVDRGTKREYRYGHW